MALTSQTNLLFTGREYYSLENCLVTVKETDVDINSVIVGMYNNNMYRVEYVIKTNSNWETVFCEISCRHNNKLQHYKLESDGKGNWLLNNKTAVLLEGCIDVDIPLTPFTNTLPVNRLDLAQQAEKEIKVVYIDLLEEKIHAVRQKYRRLSKSTYHYENVPNDFEADIEVDPSGFVTDYPQLFIRTAAHKSNYPV